MTSSTADLRRQLSAAKRKITKLTNEIDRTRLHRDECVREQGDAIGKQQARINELETQYRDVLAANVKYRNGYDEIVKAGETVLLKLEAANSQISTMSNVNRSLVSEISAQAIRITALESAIVEQSLRLPS